MPPTTTAPPETDVLRSPPVTAGLDSADQLDEALARPEQLLLDLQSQVGNQALTSAVQRAPEDELDGGVETDADVDQPATDPEAEGELRSGGADVEDALSSGPPADGAPQSGGAPPPPPAGGPPAPGPTPDTSTGRGPTADRTGG